jgi:hypothetical protein
MITTHVWRITNEQDKFLISNMAISTEAKAAYDKRRADEKRAEKLAVLEAQQPGIIQSAEGLGIDPMDITHGWAKDDKFSMFFKLKDGTDMTWEKATDAIIERMNAHSPVNFDTVYEPVIDPHLFVYNPADLHLNKLALAFETGVDYNSQIAVKRAREALKALLRQARGYYFDQILFVLGNDIFNADGPSNATTKGTRQDTHTLWFDAYLMGYDLTVEQIEICAKIAPVVVKFNPSNHDVMTGFFLAHAISAYFRNHPNVTVDFSTAHRKYLRYGNNLIGTTHGDGAKLAKLPLIMATECKVDWGLCKHYYIYTAHVHHKDSKDYNTVCVESLRSPSEADGWHSRNGYLSIKAIEAFVHHPEHGQVARFTHIF